MILEFISKLIKNKQTKFNFIIILIGACVTNNLYDVTEYFNYLYQWRYFKYIQLLIEYANYICTTFFIFLAYIVVVSMIATLLLDTAEKRNIYLDEHLIAYKLMTRSINQLQLIYEYLVIVFLLGYLLNNATILSYWKNFRFVSVYFYIPTFLSLLCTLVFIMEIYTTYFYIYTYSDEKSDDAVFEPRNKDNS